MEPLKAEDPIMAFYETIFEIWASKQDNVEEAVLKLARDIKAEASQEEPTPTKTRKPRVKKSVPPAE